VGAIANESNSENIIFFDGVCSLCNSFVDFLIARDKKKIFRYGPLQGHKAQERLPMSRVKLASVVYLKNGVMLTQSEAALEILSDLGGVWSLVTILKLIPHSVRDSVYSIIATNRYKWFGRRETCRLPSKEERSLFLD
jgi:predicted DCC family thiol-disulfide oxidoreductase YuxK